MITIRKLSTLPPRTRIRKIARLFHQCGCGSCHPSYLLSLVTLAQETLTDLLGSGVDHAFLNRLPPLIESGDEALPLALEDGYHLLLSALGETVADWDLEDGEGELDRSKRTIWEHYLVIDRVRSPYNVGSIFRSADSFGIKKIFLIEGSGDPGHSRALRTSGGTTATVDYEVLTEDGVCTALSSLALPLFALESGGGAITSFAFPERGAAVVGSEELGVSARMLALCDGSLGRASILLGGTKGSLNVAASSAIMLSRWYAQ